MNEETAKAAGEREFRNTILNLRTEMKKVIFGQEPAIDALDRALKVSFSGLRTKNKTAGAFLFLGPTGSGKTETAEQLANKLGVPCKKIDCGEFQHSHDLAKLVGAPPGYLGHRDTKGILTAFYEQVKNARYGVLILDEIEKADPALYQLCLGMLDKATVSDGSNAELNFGNVIVIMTSNIGEKDRKRTTMGFPAAPVEAPLRAKTGAADVTIDEAGKQARALAIVDPMTPAAGKSGNSQKAAMLRLVFSPEFLGRLDGVVNFADLGHELIPLIADKFIAALQQQAKSNPKGAVDLEVTPAARRYVVENGYKAEKGARSILNFMDEAIVGRLAEELIAGDLEGGGTAVVDVEEDAGTHQRKLRFTFSRAAGNKAMAATSSTTLLKADGAGELRPRAIGDAMSDGSIYAGMSPETGMAMYATPHDAPLTYTFNQAQEYAAKLEAHGHQDWRVPKKGELNVLFQNRAAIGGFNVSGSVPTGWYWSASQGYSLNAWDQRFSDGAQSFDLKDDASSLRCVR